MMFLFVSQQRAQHHPKSQPTNPAFDFVPREGATWNRGEVFFGTTTRLGWFFNPTKTSCKTWYICPKCHLIWWDLTFRNDGFINMSYQVAPNFAIWKSRFSTQKHISNMALDIHGRCFFCIQVIWTFLHYHQLQAMWLEARIFCQRLEWGQVVMNR